MRGGAATARPNPRVARLLNPTFAGIKTRLFGPISARRRVRVRERPALPVHALRAASFRAARVPADVHPPRLALRAKIRQKIRQTVGAPLRSSLGRAEPGGSPVILEFPVDASDAPPFVRHSALGQIAQLVEQRTENPRVLGSIPSLATTFNPLRKQCLAGFLSPESRCGASRESYLRLLSRSDRRRGETGSIHRAAGERPPIKRARRPAAPNKRHYRTPARVNCRTAS